MAQALPLLNHLRERAELWGKDAQQLRDTGKEKGCDKCLVAAEVYDECASQLRDIITAIERQ